MSYLPSEDGFVSPSSWETVLHDAWRPVETGVFLFNFSLCIWKIFKPTEKMQEEKQYKEPRTRALYPFAPLALSFACSHSLALDVYAYVIRNIDFLTT